MIEFFDKLSLQLRKPGAKWFGFSIIMCSILAFSGLLEPLETPLQLLRDKIRNHDASGEIVLVGVDDHSLSVGSQWPWDRSKIADIVEKLDKAGASNVVVDFDLSSKSTSKSDQQLATVFDNSTANIYLQHSFSDNNGKRTHSLPHKIFSENTGLINTNVKVNYNRRVWDAPSAVRYGSQNIPSLAGMLSNRASKNGGLFPIDYGMDLNSIPTISAIDVFDDRWDKNSVKGKTVFLSGTAPKQFSRSLVDGHGLMPKAIVHIAAAETLLNNPPIVLNPMISLFLAIVVGWIFITWSSRTFARSIMIGYFAVAFNLSLLGDIIGFRMEIVPAILLALIACSIRLGMKVSNKVTSKSLHDLTSGLPNEAMLKQRLETTAGGVVALKILNFTNIEYVSIEKANEVLTSVAAIMGMQAPPDSVFHTSHGTLIAFYEGTTGEMLENSVEGLHRMVRVIAVGDQKIDITTAIGYEDDPRFCINDRARRALIACEDCAQKGEPIAKFSDAESDDLARNLVMNSELDNAVANGDVFAVFQPKYDIKTNMPVGGEMLARWLHPERGLIPPDKFVAIAEKHDRMDVLTLFMIESAARAGVQFDKIIPGITVSVNLSAKLLSKRDLPEAIEKILQRCGLPPQNLVLEITETAAMATGDLTTKIFERIRQLGIHLSIDDYGTGLSTLEYLKSVPATEIKIDKTFIDGMANNRSDTIMVRSTIQLAHSLGQKVVAEGVEDKSTFDKLKAMNCDFVQGYYMSKPLSIENAVISLQESQNHSAAA